MAVIAHIARDHPRESPAEEQFRLAVEACPNGMVMTDHVGRIVLANAAAERLFGYSHGELIGQPIEILIPERLHDGNLHQHCAGFPRGAESRCLGDSREFFGRRRDGIEFPIEVGLTPTRTREGQLLLSVLTDISGRKRMDRLKDEFVSTVSHELRTPLTSIAGSLGLLVGGAAGTLPDAAVRLIGIAQNNSQRLVRLINDILDIEKIESGQVVFKFKRLAARSLIEQVIEGNRGYADGFRVRISLAGTSATGEVYADQDRLTQVITNLLSNAIKFSPTDGEVVVSVEERGKAVRIAVRDHGPGIPAAFGPHIFEKFAQADATDARQKGGTGLGLSIVKQIVTRLGGSVGFGDAPGGGTVFYVDLPSWNEVAAREIDADRGPQGTRVLLCEDNLDTAFALREGLWPSGFSTDFAHSPAEAVSRVQATSYAAILVDLDLPDGDGVGLIRRLREQPESYRTPIVILSTDGNRDKSDLGSSKRNVVACVDKPVDVDRLAEILDRAIVLDGNGRPQILHIDDDPDVLELVAHKLDSTASVISVDSVDEARRAILIRRFDLAILDISLGVHSGLDLLPELRSRKGVPIPVIIFSAHVAELEANPQVEANLDKSSSASLNDLVVAVHDRLMLRSTEGARKTS